MEQQSVVLQYLYTLTPGVYLLRTRVPEAPLSVCVADPAARMTVGFRALVFRAMQGGSPSDMPTWLVEDVPEKAAGEAQMFYQGQGVRPPYFFVPQVVPAINIATSHPCVAVPLFLPLPTPSGAGVTNLWIRGTEGAQPMPLVANEDEAAHPPSTRGVSEVLSALLDTLRHGAPAASDAQPQQIEANKPPSAKRGR